MLLITDESVKEWQKECNQQLLFSSAVLKESSIRWSLNLLRSAESAMLWRELKMMQFMKTWLIAAVKESLLHDFWTTLRVWSNFLISEENTFFSPKLVHVKHGGRLYMEKYGIRDSVLFTQVNFQEFLIKWTKKDKKKKILNPSNT